MWLYIFKSQFVNVTKKKVVTKGMIIKGVYRIRTLPTITLNFFFFKNENSLVHVAGN
jgi:hypothetical protein